MRWTKRQYAIVDYIYKHPYCSRADTITGSVADVSSRDERNNYHCIKRIENSGVIKDMSKGAHASSLVLTADGLAQYFHQREKRA